MFGSYPDDLYTYLETHGDLENVSRSKDFRSNGSLRGFIGVAQKTNPSRVSLLSLTHRLFEDEGNGVAQVVQPYASETPGFSNRLLNQPEQYTPNEVRATMAWNNIIAAVLSREQARDERYMRHIINEEVPRNVIASYEDQLINGSGSGITGLLHTSDAVSLALSDMLPYIKSNPSRTHFYRHALEEYASRAGRKPTHIILPYKEIVKLFASEGAATRESPNKLFGIPIIESNSIPEGRGLLLAVDEIVLASHPGLEWKYGRSTRVLESLDLLAIMLGCKIGLLIKRPETIVRLNFDETPLPSPSLLKALAKPESES